MTLKRPNYSVQNAIWRLDNLFQSSKWVIEGDLSKAFDSISHKKLLELLSTRITCQKTIALIKSMIKAGYIDNLGELINNYIEGTPQGSVLSPLLCNIYLTQLDEHIEELKRKYNSPPKTRKNIEYTKWANKIKYMRTKGSNAGAAMQPRSIELHLNTENFY